MTRVHHPRRQTGKASTFTAVMGPACLISFFYDHERGFHPLSPPQRIADLERTTFARHRCGRATARPVSMTCRAAAVGDAQFHTLGWSAIISSK
jgi:hypothetical protein